MKIKNHAESSTSQTLGSPQHAVSAARPPDRGGLPRSRNAELPGLLEVFFEGLLPSAKVLAQEST